MAHKNDLARAREEAAYLRGRLQSIRDRLMGDPEFLDAMRAHAWLRHDRSRVALGDDGSSLVCPDEWPTGVDATAYVDRYLETQDERSRLLAELERLDVDL